MRFYITLLLLAVFLALPVTGKIILYSFDDPAKEKQFKELIQELRCPKCQNNNLADSNSPLAIDLKEIVYEKILAGESQEEIVTYLKERYGDFISYRPPLNPSTWFIWFGPFILVAIGTILIFRFVFRPENFKIISDNIETQQIEMKQGSTESSIVLQQWIDELGESDSSEQACPIKTSKTDEI